MTNTKKVIAGITALAMTTAFTACGNNSDSEETTAATTTTGVTVEINTAGLEEDEQTSVDNIMSQLRDVELENTEIKWLANYDLNPSTDGSSKSVALELFEQKYGGTITYYPTEWASRYDQLSNYMLSGEGIDMFPGTDEEAYPSGISSGKFVPVDDYIDMDSAIWQNVSAAMELYNFGGKHYKFVTGVNARYYLVYNTETIEANGLDDPWELYEEGNWNWDTFKSALLEYVDTDNDRYGLDNWYNSLALLYSAGVPSVSAVDGHVVNNINDPTVEKAMNFQAELWTNGLVLDLNQFGWSLQLTKMSQGEELFAIIGSWEIQGDPSTWSTQIEPENLGVVPVPSPEGSDPYQTANVEGYALCKGAANPEAVALFAECSILATYDDSMIAISDRKSLDDNQWSQDILDRVKEINELARQYPVVDFASGVSSDFQESTWANGESAYKAAFYGVSDWATAKAKYADQLDTYITEADEALQARIAEN